VGLDHFEPDISVNSFPFNKNERSLDHFDPGRRWRPGMQERKTTAPAADAGELNIRRKRYSPGESEDLSQGFFARVLEHGTLLDARQERGRFRSFQLASVTHFPANEWDRAHQGRALRRPVRNHGPELPMAEPGYREPAARGAIQR
jgi:hypothetical protein